MLNLLTAFLLIQSLVQADSTATTSTTTSRTSVCTPGSTFISGAGRTCTKYCGVDRPGGDYARQRYAYIDGNGGCLQACANDPTCTTAQYNEDNQFCYFKNTRNANVTSTNTDTVDCTPACYQTTFSSNGRQCQIVCSQDRPGGDYDRFRVASSADCANACAADPTCVSAQFSRNNGFCYLKNQITRAVASSSVDSVTCVPNGYCNNAQLSIDNNNCGGCGIQCANNEYCTNFACVPRWDLCKGGQPWGSCGSSTDCICWATKEGDGVCLPHSIYNDGGCATSRDCRAGESCWGPWGGTSSWGLCVNTQSYVPQCRNGANPLRLFARGMSPRHRKRDSNGSGVTAVVNPPVVTLTDSSGHSWNVTIS